MIVKNHNIELKDTSESEMARFRQIMLSIWRQQIEDDKNSAEMENFCTNYPYVCNDQNSEYLNNSDGMSSGSDFEIDQDGNITLKRKTKNHFDRLYKGEQFIGKVNKGSLVQLEGKNIINSDFNEIKFNNRPDLNSFLNLTLKIQDAYDREVSALMVGQRTTDLIDLRTKNYDLLLVGLQHSKKNIGSNGVLEGYSNLLPDLMKRVSFDKDNSCLTIEAKSYDIAGFYHTHPIGGPQPSSNIDKFGNPNGDLYIYNKYNLPGYIRGTNGWSIVAPDGTGKIQYDPDLKIEIFKK